MAAMVDELKAKWSELSARLEVLRDEAARLEGQKAAFETAIACYDPDFSQATTRSVESLGCCHRCCKSMASLETSAALGLL